MKQEPREQQSTPYPNSNINGHTKIQPICPYYPVLLDMHDYYEYTTYIYLHAVYGWIGWLLWYTQVVYVQVSVYDFVCVRVCAFVGSRAGRHTFSGVCVFVSCMIVIMYTHVLNARPHSSLFYTHTLSTTALSIYKTDLTTDTRQLPCTILSSYL